MRSRAHELRLVARRALLVGLLVVPAACSTVVVPDPEDDGAGGAGAGASGVTTAETGATTALVTASVSSSSTGGLAEPRLPPCTPEMVDDFEDPAHTSATWENAVVSDGALVLTGTDVVLLPDLAAKPFEDCRISLRLVEADSLEGSLHCHLDPSLDADHDYANIALSQDGASIELQSGSGLGATHSDTAPVGRLVALVFDGPRVRGLLADEEETAWVVMFDEPRPAFFDLPFSPCVLQAFSGTGRVDDVNVIPPALYGL